MIGKVARLFFPWIETLGKLKEIADKMRISEGIKEILGNFFSSGGKYQSYNIGLFGPSRIGKTTLIASMVEEFKRFTNVSPGGRYLKLTSLDEPTMTRLSGRINDLKSGIREGVFATGTLEGTANHEVFNLRFEEGGKEKSFQQLFTLHDFPGGWVNDPSKIEVLDIANWDVVILPIDAAVVMENVGQKKYKTARNSLCIDQVEDFIRNWTQLRGDTPSMCILVPVKCETYFEYPKMHRGLTDKSRELRIKIQNEFYGEVINIINKSSNIECLYMPVNTIGCCYLKKPTWTPDGYLEGEYVISRGYGMDKWNPYGPSYIMIEVCLFIAKQLRRLPNVKNSKITSFLQSIDALEQIARDPKLAPSTPYDRKFIIQRGRWD